MCDELQQFSGYSSNLSNPGLPFFAGRNLSDKAALRSSAEDDAAMMFSIADQSDCKKVRIWSRSTSICSLSLSGGRPIFVGRVSGTSSSSRQYGASFFLWDSPLQRALRKNVSRSKFLLSRCKCPDLSPPAHKSTPRWCTRAYVDFVPELGRNPGLQCLINDEASSTQVNLK